MTVYKGGEKYLGYVRRTQGLDAELALIKQAIRETNGNIRRTALFLGMGRRHVYRRIWFFDLEGFVAAARAAARHPKWLLRTGRELLRDERDLAPTGRSVRRANRGGDPRGHGGDGGGQHVRRSMARR